MDTVDVSKTQKISELAVGVDVNIIVFKSKVLWNSESTCLGRLLIEKIQGQNSNCSSGVTFKVIFRL